MKLSVEPNFDIKEIKCAEDLEITCLDDLAEPSIELDCAELNIKRITYNDFHNLFLRNLQLQSNHQVTELGYLQSNKKVVIQLPNNLKKEASFSLTIEYSAKPKKGFHFIPEHVSEKNVNNKQAWTQGQMIESKYWFPCIDDPQIKYPRQVSITVPKDFSVISNGDLDNTVNMNNNKNIYIWKEDNPNSTYLTSIVIGKFFESQETYEHSDKCPNLTNVKLFYYLPEDKADRVKRTFGDTLDMMKFFESYFDTPYPYNKYAQTTVRDFEYGGMEILAALRYKKKFFLIKKLLLMIST